MDKFDQSIRQAKQTYEPDNKFVEATMKQIVTKQPHKLWNMKLWAPALAGSLIVIVLVFIALPIGNHKSALKNDNPVASQSANTPASQTATQPATGTDNAGLASDLSDIDSSMNQENNDQNSANSALNDSAQQISVPTD
jgi:hypothetical protein